MHSIYLRQLTGLKITNKGTLAELPNDVKWMIFDNFVSDKVQFPSRASNDPFKALLLTSKQLRADIDEWSKHRPDVVKDNQYGYYSPSLSTFQIVLRNDHYDVDGQLERWNNFSGGRPWIHQDLARVLRSLPRPPVARITEEGSAATITQKLPEVELRIEMVLAANAGLLSDLWHRAENDYELSSFVADPTDQLCQCQVVFSSHNLRRYPSRI